ncbi:hypothetical protein Poli38472_012112 [Pythium oligandrum]|uniref:glucan endo-1,3-beta-D-glucosidase n=1 Tax=Pythium oligandrum TaxID=41045 RepID=A0A8K1CNP8_PYTOL|nr:hypothetical protein Poli38472_012112 [Pythium oligandrum]|eukprot:TMW66996.1 hypothetical protein Poli38472_012112 [Pythium oligandrum]
MRTSFLRCVRAGVAFCGLLLAQTHAVATNEQQLPLPFPVADHPLTLATTLFDATQPLYKDAVNADQRNATSITTENPQFLGDVPFPTGAWWTNLVLDKGDMAVVSMPYVFKVIDGKLRVSYPFRVVMPHVIQNGFLSQLVVSSVPVTAKTTTSPLQHQVVGFDTFAVTVRFARPETKGDGEFLVHLVRGSPYVTMEYKNTVPVIESMDGLLLTRLKRFTEEENLDSEGEQLPFATYAIQLSNNQVWYVFASDPSINLQLVHGKVVADDAYTGVLRIALSLTADSLPHLLDSAAVYPVGGNVKYALDSSIMDTDVVSLEFHWKTQQFANMTSKKPLLMLTLPHHVDMLVDPEASTIETLRYTSIRGMMTGILGDVWKMRESLPTLDWDYPDQGLFDKQLDGEEELVKKMRTTATDAIIASLKTDVTAYSIMGVDSYNFGKQIGREARLLLMAKRFNQNEIADDVLTKIKRELEPWLTASNYDRLVYDQTFGGVVTSVGLRDQGADYGNGYYNDHHFHYGYFIYALAVVRKFDPAFIEQHASACAMLLGDIGTPLIDSNTTFFKDFPAQTYFPVARHKDWFVGHSYASGMFPMEVGKSQESSSEAVNAYYGLSLFGSLDEDAMLNPESYAFYARLLLASEIRSAKKYWHMYENSAIYEPVFAKNAMVGVVGEMSVVYSTWFGDRPVYVHGINMIPFTPATPQLITEAYVAREYVQLRQDAATLDANDIWKSAVVLDHAILDAEAAWEELTTGCKGFDMWNSKANSLLWVATRPSWFAQRDRAQLTKPNMHDDEKCFGFPGCSTAGANGTALLCCSSLPGCCPSELGCCPKKDTSKLPLNACFGEHQCAVLGLGCCNSLDGCCQPDPITGMVLGCCKDQTPRKPVTTTTAPSPSSTDDETDTPGFCTAEPRCGALKLQCCGSPEGCCEPDPITGVKLGCCLPSPAPKQSGGESGQAGTCHSQPRCAAAGLECCGAPGGCCKPDPVTGMRLDCCDGPITAVATITASFTSNGSDSCHEQPLCAQAGLDCCLSPEGCCKPDPVTGAKLLCCQDNAVTNSSTSPAPTAPSTDPFGTCHEQPLCAQAGLDCCSSPEGCCKPDPVTGAKLLCCQDNSVTNSTDSPAPTTPAVDPFGTCHNEPACLTAGEGNGPLNCCATPEGCCPGLLCCSASKEVSTGNGSDTSSSGHVIPNIVAIIVVVVAVSALAFGIAMCYRRRNYAPIDHDMRVWTCGVLMAVVVVFFVYLTAMA